MKNIALSSLLILILLSFTQAVMAVEGLSYQMRVLTQPSQMQLQRELQGKVFIYDHLTSQQVDTALDNEFNRIENMMFVSTLYTRTNGDIEQPLDDGCD